MEVRLSRIGSGCRTVAGICFLGLMGGRSGWFRDARSDSTARVRGLAIAPRDRFRRDIPAVQDRAWPGLLMLGPRMLSRGTKGPTGASDDVVHSSGQSAFASASG